jgi:hypothetical protein
MGVAPTRGIALRDDQHVLRQRREVLAAQRATVRRRLAVLRASHVPPPRGLRLGHRSKDRTTSTEHGIVAPVDQLEKRIVVETERYRISGILRMPRDGYRSRLTDYLNASERDFIPLTDVEVALLDGRGEPERAPFVAISLSHIVFAMPDAPEPSEEWAG